MASRRPRRRITSARSGSWDESGTDTNALSDDNNRDLLYHRRRYVDTISDDDCEPDDQRSISSTSFRRSTPVRPNRMLIPWKTLFSAPRKYHLSEEDEYSDFACEEIDEHNSGLASHDDLYTSDDYFSTGEDTDIDRAFRRRGYNGLHQRRHRTDHTDHGSSDVLSPLPPHRAGHHSNGRLARLILSRETSSPSKNKTRGWSSLLLFCRSFRMILVVVAISYMYLVLHVYQRVAIQHDVTNILVLSNQLEKRHLTRSYFEKKQFSELQQIRDTSMYRSQARRLKTRSLVDSLTVSQEAKGYMIHHDDAVDPQFLLKINYQDENESPLPASMEDLCGFYAQNASLAFPVAFPSRHALATGSSRVLITGITNPVGVRLAIVLKESCGIQHIVGIDYMFPNTVSSRLAKIPILQFLKSRLGSVLERPIMTANIAMDPRKSSGVSSKDAVYLESADGSDAWLDLVQTFEPTHIVHLASYAPEVYKSSVHTEQSANAHSTASDHPSMYSLRSSLTAMEQILQSIARAPDDKRPQLVYMSSSYTTATCNDKFEVMHKTARLLDEILAHTYQKRCDVQSLAIRIPNAVYGPWGHIESSTYQVMDQIVNINGDENGTLVKADEDIRILDLLFVGDVVEGLVAAMQFRRAHSKSLALDFNPLASISMSAFRMMTRSLFMGLQGNEAGKSDTVLSNVDPKEISPGLNRVHQIFGWGPSTSLSEGVIRTLAWQLDQRKPNGIPLRSNESMPPHLSSGDELLQRHSLATCGPEELVCHSASKYVPCASECSTKLQCSPSIFDNIIPLMQEVTENCDIVLYTQSLGRKEELTMVTDYMAEGNPLICSIAFVSFESSFVQKVVKKAPDSELAKLGVVSFPDYGGTPENFLSLQREKLNGRLLYLGWLLVWPNSVPSRVSHDDSFLLKLSPGRFFSSDVKYSIFVEHNFGASPRTADVYFLASEMSRPAIPKTTVKDKSPPKTKFRLPAEPRKRAVLLVPELRRQESSNEQRLHSNQKLSIKKASHYMRFEVGEDPIGRESRAIRSQREFYERLQIFVNSHVMRDPSEPVYKFELRQLAGTRWVVHDMHHESSRQLRCDWYREHITWNGSPLDQLSFAFVMAKREIGRRVAHEELDDRVKSEITELTEMKALLTDAFEWHALLEDVNRPYSPYAEIQPIPFHSLDEYTEDDEEISLGTSDKNDEPELLFARIISDRFLTSARKSFNAKKKYKKKHDR